MGMTLAEKILARASGRERVSPDQIVIARVDLAMSHENADLVRKSFLEIGVEHVWDPSKIVIIFDLRNRNAGVHDKAPTPIRRNPIYVYEHCPTR